MGSFEYFEHTADIGMRVTAASFEELLETAAQGYARLVAPELESIEVSEHCSFDVAAAEPALVLFDLLNELLYLFETRRLVMRAIRVTTTAMLACHADCDAAQFDPNRHASGQEVKAITYHALFVELSGDRWRAQVIFDI